MLFTVSASHFHCSGIQTFKERTSFFFSIFFNHLKLVALGEKKKPAKDMPLN